MKDTYEQAACLVCGAPASRKYCSNACRQRAFHKKRIIVSNDSQKRTIEELIYVLNWYVEDKKIVTNEAETIAVSLLTLYQDDRNAYLINGQIELK